MEDRERPVARRDGAVTTEKLRDEAARLFWDKGYAATTTRELARSLGVQKASIYYHIESKEELLYDICVESLGNIHDAVSRALAGESDPLARIRVMIRAHVVSMLEDKEKHATMLTELKALSSARREEVVGLRDRYESLVRSVLLEAQDAGVLAREVSAKELELAILNLLNWTIFWYKSEGEFSPEYLARLFEEIYLNGVVRS
ncbi:MAG: TetR/AcrR family transcriptional regulator [Rubrobacteraceae bacterium]